MDSYIPARGLLHCENKLFAESAAAALIELSLRVTVSRIREVFDPLYDLANFVTTGYLPRILSNARRATLLHRTCNPISYLK